MLNNNLPMLEQILSELGNGIIYALYTNKEVVFKSYRSIDEVKEDIESDSLLELHLFDKDKEYRYVKAINKEFLINDSVEHDDIYKESIYVNDSYTIESKNTCNKINVINYIKYTDDDLLTIVNYRLQKVGE